MAHKEKQKELLKLAPWFLPPDGLTFGPEDPDDPCGYQEPVLGFAPRYPDLSSPFDRPLDPNSQAASALVSLANKHTEIFGKNKELSWNYVPGVECDLCKGPHFCFDLASDTSIRLLNRVVRYPRTKSEHRGPEESGECLLAPKGSVATPKRKPRPKEKVELLSAEEVASREQEEAQAHPSSEGVRLVPAEGVVAEPTHTVDLSESDDNKEPYEGSPPPESPFSSVGSHAGDNPWNPREETQTEEGGARPPPEDGAYPEARRKSAGRPPPPPVPPDFPLPEELSEGEKEEVEEDSRPPIDVEEEQDEARQRLEAVREERRRSEAAEPDSLPDFPYYDGNRHGSEYIPASISIHDSQRFLISIDLHNCADSGGRGSDFDRSFDKYQTRPISEIYIDYVIRLVDAGWWVIFLSYIGLDSHSLREESKQKVRDFNAELSARVQDIPAVQRQLPIRLEITGGKTHFKHGKPAVHCDIARRLSVRPGVHVDGSQEVCDALAPSLGTKRGSSR